MEKVAQHTKGPWSFRELAGGGWFVEPSIGVVYSDPFTKRERVEGNPNARLIAAAPDLLAVAHAVVDMADDRTLPAILNAAQAAIAKAEGRS